MTNRSFFFRVSNSRYIMRIPGEGTDQLIDREQEADVYKAIASKRYAMTSFILILLMVIK